MNLHGGNTKPSVNAPVPQASTGIINLGLCISPYRITNSQYSVNIEFIVEILYTGPLMHRNIEYERGSAKIITILHKLHNWKIKIQTYLKQ